MLENLPPVHPTVVEKFARRPESGEICFYPIGFDLKLIEAFRTLLVPRHGAAIVANFTQECIPVFSVMPPDRSPYSIEELYCEMQPQISIFFDLHDPGIDRIYITEAIWRSLVRSGNKVIYIKLQSSTPAHYEHFNALPSQVIILSCPLLLGGSHFHITWQDDYDGEYLFRSVFRDNPTPNYEYDWCWIGSNTANRAIKVDALRQYNQRPHIIKEAPGGHITATTATTPYHDYIRIAMQSKINISLNGIGPWCLKDGEMFAHDCFVLREDHLALELNPLSPKNGYHWIVSPYNCMPEVIECLLEHDQERETIRSRGHDYFREVIHSDLFSNTYLTCLREYIGCGSRQAWQRLAFG